MCFTIKVKQQGNKELQLNISIKHERNIRLDSSSGLGLILLFCLSPRFDCGLHEGGEKGGKRDVVCYVIIFVQEENADWSFLRKN